MQSQLFPIFVRTGKRTDQFRAGFIDVRGNVMVDPVYECCQALFEKAWDPCRSPICGG